MLAGLLVGILHHRKLMCDAEVNIAIRWLIGYGLHEKLPHHSSLTRFKGPPSRMAAAIILGLVYTCGLREQPVTRQSV